MKLRRPLALALLVLASVRAWGDDKEKVIPKTLVELESEIGKVLADSKTPGVGVTLVSRDAVLWTAGIGTADVASGRT